MKKSAVSEPAEIRKPTIVRVSPSVHEEAKMFANEKGYKLGPMYEQAMREYLQRAKEAGR